MATFPFNQVAYGLSQSLINVFNPPIISNRNPVAGDQAALGTIWINKSANSAYVLIKVQNGSSTWAGITAGSSGSVDALAGNSGSASPVGGSITVAGSGVLSSAASGHTVTMSLSNGTNGQLIIGGGAAPAWASMTSTDGSVVITTGANSIDLAVGGAEAHSFVSGSGTATPAAGVLSVPNGSNIDTTGSTNVLTINLVNSPSVSGSLTAATGITSTSGNITATAGNVTAGLNVSSAGNVTGGTGLTATTGNVIATTGNFVASAAGQGVILGGGAKVVCGTGDPNTVVTAPQGSLYLRLDGSSASTRAYINSDSATTWIAVTTAS